MIDVLDKERQVLDPKLKDLLEESEDERGGFVYCATCSHVLARQSDRIEVNGSHAHTLTNPYGISFNLGCFAEALGCSISGKRTAADTWFAGFRWRYASCEECKRHLGWYFDRADVYFYGLILDNIQID